MSDAPVIYDHMTDEWRPVTQAEVDELCRVKAAYGNLRLMSQSVLAESHKIAQGVRHKDAERDLGAYMTGEDVRQNAEFEKRLDASLARYDHGADLEACLADLDAHVAAHPFPRYGAPSTTRLDTSGDYLEPLDPK